MKPTQDELAQLELGIADLERRISETTSRVSYQPGAYGSIEVLHFSSAFWIVIAAALAAGFLIWLLFATSVRIPDSVDTNAVPSVETQPITPPAPVPATKPAPTP